MVDLPAPFGPRNPVTWPAGMSMEKPSSARAPNDLVRSWVRTAGRSMRASPALVLPTVGRRRAGRNGSNEPPAPLFSSRIEQRTDVLGRQGG